MGPLGGMMTVKLGSRQAVVTQLDSRSAGAKAGLETGDVIVGANGKRFDVLHAEPSTGGDGVPRDFGLALLESQADGVPLVLEVERADGNLKIEVELPQLADFAAEFPQSCERSEFLITAAAEWLAEQHDERGNFASGSNYTNSLAGLALLSTGDRRYRSVLRDNARRLSSAMEGQVPGSNWIACAMGIFLAEYHLATGETGVLDALEKCCIEMADRVDPATGRLGHNGKALPYDNKGLVITSVHMHLMWALASQCGIEIDKQAWDLSYKSIDDSLSENGSVGYNFSARGSSQSAARTGLMATAIELCGLNRADGRRMIGWCEENYKRNTNGHATTSMGLVWGFMGSSQAGDRAHRNCMDYHRWLFALCTPADDKGGVFYYCKRGNFGGDGYLGYRAVGNYQMLMMLNSPRRDTLWCFGNRSQGWLKK